MPETLCVLRFLLSFPYCCRNIIVQWQYWHMSKQVLVSRQPPFECKILSMLPLPQADDTFYTYKLV